MWNGQDPQILESTKSRWESVCSGLEIQLDSFGLVGSYQVPPVTRPGSLHVSYKIVWLNRPTIFIFIRTPRRCLWRRLSYITATGNDWVGLAQWTDGAGCAHVSSETA